MKTYDESLKEVKEALEKRGMGTYQSASPDTGLRNLDLLWSRVWNYDAAKGAKDSARAAWCAMWIAIGSLIVNCIMVFCMIYGK